MTKDIFQTIGSSKENFRMTEAESQDIKAALMAHMKANPVKQQNNFFASLMRPMRMAVSALSVVLVATVGVSYAAEASLPGELLYPVKVNVMEEVVSTLKINKEAKAEYAVVRAEKRIEEAIELAEMGGLTPEVEIQVLESLEEHAQKVEELVVELEGNEETEESQKIQHEWNKLLVENQPIVLQLVQEEVETIDTIAPVIESLPEVELETEVTETADEVIEVLPEIQIEVPIVEEPVIEVIEILPTVDPEPKIEILPVIEVSPVIEMTPALEEVIEVTPVVEEPIIEVSPVIEVTPVLEEVIDVTPIEVLPEIQIEVPIVEEPVIEVIEILPTVDPEPVVEHVIEFTPVTPSPILIDSGLLFDLNGGL